MFHISYIELQIWNQVSHDHRSFEHNLSNCEQKPEKSGLNGVWTRDLAIPVRRSNQLSYEATDVGSWSFVSSKIVSRGFCSQLLKLCSKLRWSWLTWCNISQTYFFDSRALIICVAWLTCLAWLTFCMSAFLVWGALLASRVWLAWAALLPWVAWLSHSVAVTTFNVDPFSSN